MLRRVCFDGSEFFVGLLCSFDPASALRLVSPIKHWPQEQTSTREHTVDNGFYL